MNNYHREIFWPKRIENILPFGVRKIEYSTHAMREAKKDRYGEIPLLSEIDLSTVYIFEATERSKGQLLKFGFRVTISNGLDIVMIVMPNKKGLFVKTLWFNQTNDDHKTLNRSNYVKQD